MLTINDRLKKIRKEKGLTLKQFGKAIGITDASVSQMETGKSGLSNQTIHSICREFDINEDWLRTGKGEMFTKTPSSEVDELARKYNLTPEARILVERFLLLKPEVQQGIVDYIVDAAAVINGEITVEKSVDQMVEEYRAELLAAQKGADASSALPTQSVDTEKMA